MRMFKLDRAKAVIKKLEILGAGTIAADKEARSVKVATVKAVVEVDVTSCLANIEALFPNAKVLCNQIAGDENLHGNDIGARGKLAETSLVLYTSGSSDPDVSIAGVEVVGKTLLRVDKDGNAVLVIRPQGKFTAGQLTAMWEFVPAADCEVSMKETTLQQIDIDDYVEDEEEEEEEEAPPVKKKRGRPPKQKAAPAHKGPHMVYDATGT